MVYGYMMDALWLRIGMLGFGGAMELVACFG